MSCTHSSYLYCGEGCVYPMPIPSMWSVTVQVETPGIWHSSYGLPSFFVQAFNEAEAIRRVKELLEVNRRKESTFHICAVAL